MGLWEHACKQSVTFLYVIQLGTEYSAPISPISRTTYSVIQGYGSEKGIMKRKKINWLRNTFKSYCSGNQQYGLTFTRQRTSVIQRLWRIKEIVFFREGDTTWLMSNNHPENRYTYK